MRLIDKNIISIIRWLLTTYIYFFAHTSTAQNNNKGGFNSDKSAYSIDINIFNIFDDHLVDTSYMGNQETFVILDSLMQDTSIINHTRMINVTSSSSIEGHLEYNRNLSKRRMKTIESIFRKRYDFIPSHVWNFGYIAENWDHLRRSVVEDETVPSRREVLSIIDIKTQHPDTLEYRLKKLHKGVPWRYINYHILPSSRGSVSMLFVPIAPTYETTVEPIWSKNINIPKLEPIPTTRLPTTYITETTKTTPTYSRPIMSLRTNLLLDVTSTINIALEVPLAPRWSISAEYVNPWWKNWDYQYTWQIKSLYFDLRYWLSKRDGYNTLLGWSVGAYAGSGLYDIQPLTDRGVQGEYSDYGVTISYAHALGKSKHWAMEYTAALGYVTTHYRNYYTEADTDEYGNIKVHNYPWSEETLRSPIPTRIGVTLVYRINTNRAKRKGSVI